MVGGHGGARLAERQTTDGGLNGRPEKLQDVCYSWWCLSALALLGRTHWIDRTKLSSFILHCQVRPPSWMVPIDRRSGARLDHTYVSLPLTLPLRHHHSVPLNSISKDFRHTVPSHYLKPTIVASVPLIAVVQVACSFCKHNVSAKC